MNTNAVFVVPLPQAVLDATFCVRGVVQVDVIVIPKDRLQGAVNGRVVEERHEFRELRQQVVACIASLLLQVVHLVADHLIVRYRRVLQARHVRRQVWMQQHVPVLDELEHRVVVELLRRESSRAASLGG